MMKLVLVLLAVTATPAIAEEAKKPAKPVMVYAIAWDKQCGGNSLAYRTQMSDAKSYDKARDALKASMAAEYPNAKGIRAGSSKFEFGNDAGAVAVIEIDTSTSTCKSRAILVHFGRDVDDARDRAAKEAGKRPYKTLLQEYFVKVTTAP
jgi:hypothetical protein